MEEECIGLDCNDWLGLDHIGMDWTGIAVGLAWTALDWNGLDWIRLNWTGLDWDYDDWLGQDRIDMEPSRDIWKHLKHPEASGDIWRHPRGTPEAPTRHPGRTQRHPEAPRAPESIWEASGGRIS